MNCARQMNMRALFLLLSAAAALVAQENPLSNIQTVRASGEAVVTARPDQAVIQLGVTNQAPTAEAAATQNARNMSNVVTELKAVVGADGDVRTVGYSLNPAYRYPRDGGSPTITGYNASNTVEVRLNELSKIGKVIDTATKNGANTVGGIQYALRNEEAARAEALAKASRAARANAQAIASALGLRIVRIHSAEAGFANVPRPVMPMMRGAAALQEAAPPTPVEPGTIEIRTSVNLVLEVAQ